MSDAATIAARFAGRPWRNVPRSAFGRAAAIPTMLHERERRFYLWAARDWAEGVGEIVDLGCFLGGSTAHLAEGRAQAGREEPIHGYDRFRLDAALGRRFLGVGSPLSNTCDAVAGMLAEWTPPIHLHRGDLAQAVWERGPIEILAIDAAKTAEVADRIAATFFPALIPGRSLVIHQDLLHWRQPWLPAQMAWMHDAFLPVARAGRDLVAYICTDRPSADILAAGRVTRRRDPELAAGLDQAAEDLRDLVDPDRLAMQQDTLAANPNRRRSKDFRVRGRA